MKKLIKNVKNQAVNQILTVAEPFLVELIERYAARAAKKGEPFTDRDREFVEVALVIDLVKATEKYLLATDVVSDLRFKTGSGGVVEINTDVTRDGGKFYIVTNMIVAGGYNVQCYHYRYLVKTNLPKTNNATALDALKAKVKKMKAEDRVKEEIARYENWLARTESELAELETKTDADVETEFYDFWVSRYGRRPSFDMLSEYAVANYGTPEAYQADLNRQLDEKKQQRVHGIKYRKNLIKQIQKDIEKFKAKLAAL